MSSAGRLNIVKIYYSVRIFLSKKEGRETGLGRKTGSWGMTGQTRIRMIDAWSAPGELDGEAPRVWRARALVR